MNGLRLVVAAALFAVCGSAVADNLTFYGSPHREGPWQGPHCDAPDVVSRIASRFDSTEATYWKTGIRMAHIVKAREVAFRDWDPPIIARRYCTATAYLSNGARYELVYWLRSEQGFAGVGWGVDFCLVGRDRHMNYAPHCRTLRPS